MISTGSIEDAMHVPGAPPGDLNKSTTHAPHLPVISTVGLNVLCTVYILLAGDFNGSIESTCTVL